MRPACSEAHLWWYWNDDVFIPSPQFMHFLWFASLNTFWGAIHHSQNHMLVLANLLVFTVVLCGQSNPEETFIQDGQEERFPYKD